MMMQRRKLKRKSGKYQEKDKETRKACIEAKDKWKEIEDLEETRQWRIDASNDQGGRRGEQVTQCRHCRHKWKNFFRRGKTDGKMG